MDGPGMMPTPFFEIHLYRGGHLGGLVVRSLNLQGFLCNTRMLFLLSFPPKAYARIDSVPQQAFIIITQANMHTV